MFSCLSANAYPLLADIYEPVEIQDELTGAVSKQWQFKETIACQTRGQTSTGIDKNAANMISGPKTIHTTENLKIRAKESISTVYRVVKIRNDFDVVWKEDIIINTEGGFQGSTIFEPKGSVPILDHNGYIIEYETTIGRQEVQKMTVYVPPPPEEEGE